MMSKNLFIDALHNYDNPQCFSLEEFEADLNRFSTIKKLITRYVEGNAPLPERLLLNHLVICFNVFGDSTVDLLLSKIHRDNWGIVFPFLILLGRLPEYLPNYNVHTSDVALDTVVIDSLRKI